MVGWHHGLNRHEFEQTLENSEGQGSLACYSLWGLKESTRQQLNYNKNNKFCPQIVSAPSFQFSVLFFYFLMKLDMVDCVIWCENKKLGLMSKDW